MTSPTADSADGATPLVSALAYLGVRSAQLAEWRDLAVAVLGMEEVDRGDPDELLLALDARSHRIRVVRADDEDVDHIGWEVAGPVELAELDDRLREESIELHPATPEELGARDVAGMSWCLDPSGQRIEFAHGFSDRAPSVGEPAFVADGLGLGHVVLHAADAPATLRFYRDVLGFRLRDQLRSTLFFLGCNPRHHSVGIADIGGAPRVLHVMVEATELSRVGAALDACLDRDLAVSLLGLHTNDRMTSFYVRTPSNFEIEFGWHGLLVDDATWETTTIEQPSIWGHRQVEPGHAPQLRPFHRLMAQPR